jgi:hypothetical protein
VSDKIVVINNVPVPLPTRTMRLSEAYQRLKRHSEKYSDRDSYSEIMIRLLDYLQPIHQDYVSLKSVQFFLFHASKSTSSKRSKFAFSPNDIISRFAHLVYNYYSQVGLDLDEHFADVFTLE